MLIATLSWGIKLQEVVALRSMEAEYMAISHAIYEGLCLRVLQKEMGVDAEEEGTFMLVNNQTSIKIAKNPLFLRRNKHIAIRYQFIRERIEMGEFVKKLSMAAELLTKHVGLKVLDIVFDWND